MKTWKKILILLIIIFIVIQFIRPPKNIAAGISANDITSHYAVPSDVQSILKKACYDCHSNNTVYPWYANIQPVYWWLNRHIHDGKEHLNFSEFTAYPISRQYKKLDDISDEVKQGDMPLPAYTYEHVNARLTPQEKEKIFTWVDATRSTIESHYPADSLKEKRD